MFRICNSMGAVIMEPTDDELTEPVNALLEITKKIVHGDTSAIHLLDEMSGSAELPEPIVNLAEQINHLLLQKETSEFRLEQMIEDLLGAQAALFQAKHDPLTGLPNRGLFHELLDKACKEAEETKQLLALMFIDLDRFKQVNDTMGHAAGDELLVQVAQRLRGSVRDEDTVSRLGGDEFTLLMCNLPSKEMGIEVAEKIVVALNTPFDLSSGQARIGGSVGMSFYAQIGGSIGISFFPEDTNSPLSLLKNADVAMYRAKEAGRNTVCQYWR